MEEDLEQSSKREQANDTTDLETKLNGGPLQLDQLNGLTAKEKRHCERKDKRRQQAQCVQKAGTLVSEGLETLFYKLGYNIAKRPWTVILCTFLVSALCGLGMIRFEIKDSSEPIWVANDSIVLTNQRWVEEHFPLRFRYNMFIVTADNILTPSILQEMLRIDTRVKDMIEYNNTESEVYNFNWTSVCIKLGTQCWSNSILELWNFNESVVNEISDTSEIVNKLSLTKTSPVYRNEYKYQDWLGGITYDSSGQIVGAKAAKMLYVIQATSSDELNTHIQAPDLLWEKRFIQLGKDLNTAKEGGVTGTAVSAVRSFRDESDNSFDADVMLLMAGVCIIVAYVAIILGKFNEVEHKVYLALVGVFGIGLASLVSYGLASACGMFYGPIHPILPFLLLGLGVDDMFVVIEAWNNLTSLQKRKDLPTRVAIAMKHAGVSITVTSITDFVAFAIGASTELPALKSFCVYAALGILSLFIIQSTFFVAWMTIDQRRQDAYRDACCIWIKYSNFEPNKCSRRQFLPWFLRRFLSPLLVSIPVKVMVASMVLCMLVISSYGTSMLKTESDLTWFLPTDSYLTTFIQTQDEYFTDGTVADLYIGDIDYYEDKKPLIKLVDELESSEFVLEDSINNWHSSFLEWLDTTQGAGIAASIGVQLSSNDSYPVSEEDYYKILDYYVSTFGRQFQGAMKWGDSEPRVLKASKIGFKVKSQKSSEDEVDALEYFEELTETYFPSNSFIWSAQFRSWDTNRVIRSELYTNLGLAFVAVLIVTLLLVANIWVCVLVCLCVVITLVNVCGFMHFWGLTIDTLTSILLILSIGLAIDYSAHIGHKFMTIGGSRNERAKFTVATIGPAIINGGFSTFLAFILLATSNSYVFITFFKVFFLVVVFGLFNGLCLLPVLLSLVGPDPYLNATHIDLNSNMSLKELSSFPNGSTAQSGKITQDQQTGGNNIQAILEQNQAIIHESTQSMDKVQKYIHSLPTTTTTTDQMGMILHRIPQPNSRNYDLASSTLTSEELDTLLHNLEKQTTAATEQHTVEIHQSLQDPQRIVDSCADYLRQEKNQSEHNILQPTNQNTNNATGAQHNSNYNASKTNPCHMNGFTKAANHSVSRSAAVDGATTNSRLFYAES